MSQYGLNVCCYFNADLKKSLVYCLSFWYERDKFHKFQIMDIKNTLTNWF